MGISIGPYMGWRLELCSRPSPTRSTISITLLHSPSNNALHRLYYLFRRHCTWWARESGSHRGPVTPLWIVRKSYDFIWATRNPVKWMAIATSYPFLVSCLVLLLLARGVCGSVQFWDKKLFDPMFKRTCGLVRLRLFLLKKLIRSEIIWFRLDQFLIFYSYNFLKINN